MHAFFLSDEFSALATFVSLLGDVAILILTVYTFHLTAVSRKLELVSPSFSSSTFFGEVIGLSIMNKSLHAIPVQSVFIKCVYNEALGKERLWIYYYRLL